MATARDRSCPAACPKNSDPRRELTTARPDGDNDKGPSEHLRIAPVEAEGAGWPLPGAIAVHVHADFWEAGQPVSANECQGGA